MKVDEKLRNAVISAAKDIFSQQGLELVDDDDSPLDEGTKQVVSMLSFRGHLSGSFVYRCSMEFGNYICHKLIGMDCRENDCEFLKDSIAELLNWISGSIKRSYDEGEKIVISTPGVFIMDADNDSSGDDDEDDVAVINLRHGSYRFTIEIMMD